MYIFILIVSLYLGSLLFKINEKSEFEIYCSYTTMYFLTITITYKIFIYYMENHKYRSILIKEFSKYFDKSEIKDLKHINFGNKLSKFIFSIVLIAFTYVLSIVYEPRISLILFTITFLILIYSILKVDVDLHENIMNYKLLFGKYNGQLMGDISHSDQNYIKWLSGDDFTYTYSLNENKKYFFLVKRYAIYLTKYRDEQNEKLSRLNNMGH